MATRATGPCLNRVGISAHMTDDSSHGLARIGSSAAKSSERPHPDTALLIAFSLTCLIFEGLFSEL